jgi:hypothetical protein
LRDDGISIRSIGKLPHCKGGFLSSAWQQQQPDPQGQRSKATLSPGGGSDGVATATALFFRNTEGEATSPDGTFGKHQSKHNSNFIKRRKGDDPHPPGVCVKRPPHCIVLLLVSINVLRTQTDREMGGAEKSVCVFLVSVGSGFEQLLIALLACGLVMSLWWRWRWRWCVGGGDASAVAVRHLSPQASSTSVPPRSRVWASSARRQWQRVRLSYRSRLRQRAEGMGTGSCRSMNSPPMSTTAGACVHCVRALCGCVRRCRWLAGYLRMQQSFETQCVHVRAGNDISCAYNV